jgi:hypothetical protein
MVVTAVLLAACASCSPRDSARRAPGTGGVLGDAFAVAFGKPAPYATLDDDGDRVVFTPQALVDLSSGVVALISKEELTEGCKACAGSLTIDYLRRGPSGFSRLGSWPKIGGKGEWGRALPWTMRKDIDDGPTLVTRDDQKDGSCSSTTEELITLRPTAPVKVATIVTAMAYAPTPEDRSPPHISGAITPMVPGKRFAVVYSGTTAFRQVFRREGEVFTGYGTSAIAC